MILLYNLQKKDARLSRMFRSVSEIQPKMQHVQKRYVLLLRCKVGEIVPKRLARDEVVMSVLSCPNPRAYDRREEQKTDAGIADMCRSPPPPNRRGRTDDLGDYDTVND